MNNIDTNVFYESTKNVREKQEIKDLKYKIIILKESLAKTVKAKSNAKYKKDNDAIDGSINNFKSQIDESEKRIQKLLPPEFA